MGSEASRPDVKDMFRAAKAGNVITITAGLNDENINQRNETGETLLHLAVASNHESVVRILLDAGAIVDARKSRYCTSLHVAAENRNQNIVKLLLNAGANPNVKDSEGSTPLLLAAKAGSTEVAEQLIQNEASLDEIDRNGNTALVYAAKYRSTEIVKLLCDKGASVKKYNKFGNSSLKLAAELGDVKAVMSILMSKDPPEDEDMKVALSVAKGAAVVWTFEDAIPGVLRSSICEGALRIAAADGRVHTLGALLDTNVDIDAKDEDIGDTALVLASVNGRAECVKLLIQRGASIDVENKCGNTALHLAAHSGYVECVRFLVEAGADSTAKNKMGKTPFDVAKTDTVRRRLPNLSKDSTFFGDDSAVVAFFRNIINDDKTGT